MTMIGRTLKVLRQFHGMSQVELANALDLSNSFLSELESGKKEPTLDLLGRYSSYFDIPVSSILLFSESMDDAGKVREFRLSLASKALKLFEWVSAKDGFSDAKKKKDGKKLSA